MILFFHCTKIQQAFRREIFCDFLGAKLALSNLGFQEISSLMLKSMCFFPGMKKNKIW